MNDRTARAKEPRESIDAGQSAGEMPAGPRCDQEHGLGLWALGSPAPHSALSRLRRDGAVTLAAGHPLLVACVPHTLPRAHRETPLSHSPRRPASLPLLSHSSSHPRLFGGASQGSPGPLRTGRLCHSSRSPAIPPLLVRLPEGARSFQACLTYYPSPALWPVPLQEPGGVY